MGLPIPDNAPPDPAAAALLGKVRRLMTISLALTALALAAVFGIIGYRVFSNGESRTAAEATVALPHGARVVSTAVAEGRLMVTVEREGRTEVRLFDLETLRPRGTLQFAPAP